jgi:hypothetical protein
MASSAVVLSSAILLVKFKIAASATSVKELNILKQCCNPFNASHSESSRKKNETCV